MVQKSIVNPRILEVFLMRPSFVKSWNFEFVHETRWPEVKLPYTSTLQVLIYKMFPQKLLMLIYATCCLHSSICIFACLSQRHDFLWCIDFNIREYYPLDITFCWAFCLQKKILHGKILVIHTFLRYDLWTGEERPNFLSLC